MSYYDRSNEVSYHHTLSVIILVAFTVLMAALTCLFAYLFDQISGISKDQTWNQVYKNEMYVDEPETQTGTVNRSICTGQPIRTRVSCARETMAKAVPETSS